MPAPYRVLAFSGSLRKGSSNTGLVRLAQRLAPPELQIEWLDWISELPFPFIVSFMLVMSFSKHRDCHGLQNEQRCADGSN